MDGSWGNLTDENWERFVSNESKTINININGSETNMFFFYRSELVQGKR